MKACIRCDHPWADHPGPDHECRHGCTCADSRDHYGDERAWYDRPAGRMPSWHGLLVPRPSDDTCRALVDRLRSHIGGLAGYSLSGDVLTVTVPLPRHTQAAFLAVSAALDGLWEDMTLGVDLPGLPPVIPIQPGRVCRVEVLA